MAVVAFESRIRPYCRNPSPYFCKSCVVRQNLSSQWKTWFNNNPTVCLGTPAHSLWRAHFRGLLWGSLLGARMVAKEGKILHPPLVGWPEAPRYCQWPVKGPGIVPPQIILSSLRWDAPVKIWVPNTVGHSWALAPKHGLLRVFHVSWPVKWGIKLD